MSTTRDTTRPSPRSLGRMPRPSLAPPLLGLLSLTALLAGCAGTNLPGSVKGGECKVFERPQYVVLGKRSYDQNWIDGNVEAGVGACGWQRPAKRPASLDAKKKSASSAPQLGTQKPKKRGIFRRTIDKVLPRSRPGDATPAPVELHEEVAPLPTSVAQPGPPPAPPPPMRRAPVDELLSPTSPVPAVPSTKKSRCRLGIWC